MRPVGFQSGKNNYLEIKHKAAKMAAKEKASPSPYWLHGH